MQHVNQGLRPLTRVDTILSMPKIGFFKSPDTLEVPSGANLMKALLESGKPVASSCYGKGICTKCRVKVIEGSENLNKPNALEAATRLRVANSNTALAADERLSCQAKVIGDVFIDTTYW